jgi:hypothetical protein
MSSASPTQLGRWRRWMIGVAIVVLGIGALGPPYGLRRDRDSFMCAGCFSKRHEYQWKVGEWNRSSLSVSAKRAVMDESLIYRLFTSKPHVHDWQFVQGSPYYWFGSRWGGCAIGGNIHENDLAMILDHGDDGCAEFLIEKASSKQLSTNQIYQALVSPARWSGETNSPTESQSLAERLAADYFAQLKIGTVGDNH